MRVKDGEQTGDAGPVPPGDGAAALRRPGGEFLSRSLEQAFAAERADENHHQARVLLIASVILNSLFFLSDWRFAGTPHFWVAIPARTFVVGAAAVALLLLGRHSSPVRRQRVLVGWMAATAAGVGALVSSRSDIALFVAMMLPMIYYLAVPVSFRWTMLGGVGCSLALLAGYESGRGEPTALGLALAMLILNVAMVIVVSRSNRLERLEWLATRAARRISDELALAQAEAEKIFAASPVPKIITSARDGRIVRFNDSAVEFFGAMPTVGDIKELYVDLADRDRLLTLIAQDGEVRDFETRVRRADGAIRNVLIKASTVELADGALILAGFIDITDRKEAEENLERLAATDALTGLPNRLSFFASGRAEMMRCARTASPLALLMIDLDHFKLVNDACGHAGGDEALRGFAATCRAVVGDRGTVARLGGEEFAVLLPNTDMAAALGVAEELREAVERMPLVLRRGPVRLTTSIGVALVDPRERKLDPALVRADQALYAAKHAGRNRVVAASPENVRRAI